MTKKRKAISLTELMVYTAVISIAIMAFGNALTSLMKNSKKSQIQMQSSAELRNLLAKIETDLTEANQIIQASSFSVTFVADMVRNPNYNLHADSDGDGIENIKDPDDDNDSQQKFSLPSSDQWRVGYDLEDDDEDNDGNADVRIRIYQSTGGYVYKELSLNNQAWSAEKISPVSLKKFELTYYGSKREDLGRNIDLGNDGLPNTLDTGEGDGIISAREIDWALPATGHGNRSGSVDTTNELKYITSIAIALESDSNGDGTTDAKLNTELSPPLLPLKRKR
ncbi:MAG: hypothetical protein HY746_08290 [Elusimicrobia bacterium]|nr:hypothetical protein [Elusimicrobiota bacterium]